MSVLNLTGTDPVLLLNENPKRRKLTIQMQPYDVDNNNVGRIHIGYGFQPVATVGHGSQGEVLIGGSTILQPSTDAPLDEKFKRAVWVTSSVANQTLIVEEESEA